MASWVAMPVGRPSTSSSTRDRSTSIGRARYRPLHVNAISGGKTERCKCTTGTHCNEDCQWFCCQLFSSAKRHRAVAIIDTRKTSSSAERISSSAVFFEGLQVHYRSNTTSNLLCLLRARRWCLFSLCPSVTAYLSCAFLFCCTSPDLGILPFQLTSVLYTCTATLPRISAHPSTAGLREGLIHDR